MLRRRVRLCQTRCTRIAARLPATCHVRSVAHWRYKHSLCKVEHTPCVTSCNALCMARRGIKFRLPYGPSLQHVDYIAEQKEKEEPKNTQPSARADDERKNDDADDEDDEPATVVDLTDANNATTAKLSRSAAKAAPVYAESCLSAQERHMLTGMLYDAVYKKPDEKAVDTALWYQAGLELRWLEEWAHDTVHSADDKTDTTTNNNMTTNSSETVQQTTRTTNTVTDARRRCVKRAVLERADLHKPLSYIIGTQPFFGCNIRCVPPLLCPRPETEMWVHWFVSSYLKTKALATLTSPLRVLDLCCGTGCIGVAVAKHVPQAEVLCVDLLDCAVSVTCENAQRNQITPASRLRAVQSDMFDIFLDPATTDDTSNSEDATCQRQPQRRAIASAHAHTLDIILCNPPYVLPQQYAQLPLDITLWESKVALVGDESRELQQYRYFQELCEYGAAMLKPRRQRASALRNAPNICIEVGLQAELVASLMERSGLWDDVSLHLDLAQQPRWISANSRH